MRGRGSEAQPARVSGSSGVRLSMAGTLAPQLLSSLQSPAPTQQTRARLSLVLLTFPLELAALLPTVPALFPHLFPAHM